MSRIRGEGEAKRLAAAFAVVVVFLAAAACQAFGVVGGKTVSITAAPWTVVVREYGQPRCTGVPIDEAHVLTPGHCVMSDGGNSAKPLPASNFAIEAGVSNFNHPLEPIIGSFVR